MSWIYSDGGRKAAGYKGNTGDCVVRAITIVTELPYSQVYDSLNELTKTFRGKAGAKSNSRTGVYRKVYEAYLASLGWKWTPTMKIGQGCKVHLTPDELPKGKLIVALSRHLCAVIDGVAHDTHDPTRNGKRCVYGYYQKEIK